MKAKHTPGPWRWELNASSNDLNLCGGSNPYDLTVMDFVRWGMGGAAPRFNVDYGNDNQVMERCETMAVPVKGREHHSNWFQNINHPDARLIAAAPDLLTALQYILEHDDGVGICLGYQSREMAEAAINKALNQ